MRIAISSMGENLSDNVAELFGRCSYFIFAEVEGGKIVKTEAFKNENADQSSGAGVSVAKFLAEKRTDVVIARSVGPRAMDVLNQFSIRVYNDIGTVEEVLGKFVENKSEKSK